MKRDDKKGIIAKTTKIFKVSDFRKELKKVMPGYKWTIHKMGVYTRLSNKKIFSATGIRTSGFNRVSTLSVIRRGENNKIEYEVKSAGFGTNAPWLSTFIDDSIRSALRGLQDFYKREAEKYQNHAVQMEFGRKINENRT